MQSAPVHMVHLPQVAKQSFRKLLKGEQSATVPVFFDSKDLPALRAFTRRVMERVRTYAIHITINDADDAAEFTEKLRQRLKDRTRPLQMAVPGGEVGVSEIFVNGQKAWTL